jgi:hypothetical protein
MSDCQLVKESQSHDGKESEGDLCASSEADFGASYRQTDSKNGLFSELTAEHPQGRVQKVREGGLASLELQFGHDEFVSYMDYRKTELTRKSADWINRASRALWLSTCGTISSATLSDLREKTLAKYNCEDSKSKVLTFADSSSFLFGHSGTCVLSAFDFLPVNWYSVNPTSLRISRTLREVVY